jgi:hypothetical protein
MDSVPSLRRTFEMYVLHVFAILWYVRGLSMQLFLECEDDVPGETGRLSLKVPQTHFSFFL